MKLTIAPTIALAVFAASSAQAQTPAVPADAPTPEVAPADAPPPPPPAPTGGDAPPQRTAAPAAPAIPSLPTERPSSPPPLERGDLPAFELSLGVDGPLLLIGGGLAGSFFLLDEGEAPDCAPLCNAANINGFDSGAAGNYNETWGTVGDIATFSTILYGPVMLVAFEGLGNGLNDALVVGEAALMSSAIQVVTSYAIKRPRPRVYGTKAPESERNDANAGRSFFSGHTANGVAASVATAIAFHRIDEPVLGWVALGIGVLGSTMIGVSRVEAGSHFATDVLLGAAIGAGVGLAVPAMHDLPVRVGPLADEDAKGLALAGEW